MGTPFGDITIYIRLQGGDIDEVDKYIKVLGEHLEPALGEVDYRWLGEGFDLDSTYDVSYSGDTRKLSQAKEICKNVFNNVDLLMGNEI